MSYVSIYSIKSDGQVETCAEVRNAMAGALHIWDRLAKKYRLIDSRYTVLGNQEATKKLWSMFSKPQTPMQERILLGFTFDRVWVKKEHIPKVIAALEEFWKENNKSYDEFDKRWHDIAPTIPGVIEALRSVMDQDIRGVCFNQTSVSASPWYVTERTRCEKCEGHCRIADKECEGCGGEGHIDNERLFHFDKDKTLKEGQEPWELFGEL